MDYCIWQKWDNKQTKAQESFYYILIYIQQTAFMSVCLTPYAPEYFLPVAGLSNIMVNLSFTGFGAINAKCIKELSTGSDNENMGEIYAKVAVLNTFGSSIGLLIGLGVDAIVPEPTAQACFQFWQPVVFIVLIKQLNLLFKKNKNDFIEIKLLIK